MSKVSKAKLDIEKAEAFIVTEMDISELETLISEHFETRKAAGVALGYSKAYADRQVRNLLSEDRNMSPAAITLLRLLTGTHEKYTLKEK